MINPLDPVEETQQIDALGKVNGPAIGLIITAAIGIGLQSLSLMTVLLDIDVDASYTYSNTLGVISSGLGILFGIIVIMGALQMKDLKNHGFAVAAAITAMIPCISPCCVLGLPIGIWALVVLFDSEVKAAFQS